MTTNSELVNEAFTFITHPANERVLFGILKRLNVRPTDHYYDDVLSEGRLTYVNVFIEYVKTTSDYDASALRRFAYQRLYWRLLDYLRKLTRTNSHQTSITPDFISNQDDGFDLSKQLEDDALFATIIQLCTPVERQLLAALLDENTSLSAIARQLNISRPTLYKRRERLANKLRHLFSTSKQQNSPQK